MKKTSNSTLFVYSQRYDCKPVKYFKPTTVNELQVILAEARRAKRRVLAVGGMYSYSAIVCSNDILISMVKFNKILHFDPQAFTVKTEPGISLEDLTIQLKEKYRATLCIMSGYGKVTIGGAIVTGTHGSGINFGCIATYVTELELMTSNGQVLTLSKSQQAEVFRAALISFGTMGIILSATIQCEPVFKLCYHSYPTTLDKVISEIDVTSQSPNHLLYYWYPQVPGSNVSIVSRSRTTETTPVRPRQFSWFWDKLIGFYLFRALIYVTAVFPRLWFFINRLHFRLFCSKPVTIVGDNTLFFIQRDLLTHSSIEFSLPITRASRVIRELNDWLVRTNFPAPFHVVMRFLKADDIMLSPFYKQDSFIINVMHYKPYSSNGEYIERWFQALRDVIEKTGGGRYLWAKENNVTREQVRAMYPEFDKFESIRRELDPRRMFLNDYSSKIFQ